MKETRKCHSCGEVGHLRAVCPNRDGKFVDDVGVNFTLAVPEGVNKRHSYWILDSGSSRHLVGDASWLHDAKIADGECVQPNGEVQSISKVGTVMLRVLANGLSQVVKHTDVYYAKGMAHNLIFYGRLDAKGYALGRRGEQRVLETRDGNSVVFDLELITNVLMVKAEVIGTLQSPRDCILAVVDDTSNSAGGGSYKIQKGTLHEFPHRFSHFNYDTVKGWQKIQRLGSRSRITRD